MVSAEWLIRILLIISVVTMVRDIFKDNGIYHFIAIILIDVSIISFIYLITKV